MNSKLLFLLFFSSILLANSCPKTNVKLLNSSKWNKHDDESLKVAKNRCPVMYPDSPCLKKFEKVKENSYHAICGK